jgi:hypothetical protein
MEGELATWVNMPPAIVREELSMKNFIDKVSSQYNDQDCPVCKVREWATLPLNGKLPVGEGSQSLGVAIKVCTNCHYGRFFVQFSK